MNKYVRSFLTLETANQFVKVGVIGVLNTIVDFGLFNILRTVGVGLVLSITIAFAVATFMSYLLNRRWSFQLADGKVSTRETVQFYVINIVAWLVTLGVVGLAQAFFGPLDRIGENVAKFAAVVIILIPKFAGYRDIVFRKALKEDGRYYTTSGHDAVPTDVPEREFGTGQTQRETQPEA